MTYVQILDAAALAVLMAQSGWIALLYRRMGRLRTTLEGAGAVVGQLDAASKRLDASTGGIVRTVKEGLGEVDTKITACRRVAQELTAASRQAEEIATRLDQALRLNRKLQTARAAAPPRELAEPLGLAERLAGRAPTILDLPALEHPPSQEAGTSAFASPARESSALAIPTLAIPALATSGVETPAAQPFIPEQLAELAVRRLLAAEMVFPEPAPAFAEAPELVQPERRVFRLTLD